MIVLDLINIEFVKNIIELFNNFFELICNVLPYILVALCLKKNGKKKDTE